MDAVFGTDPRKPRLVKISSGKQQETGASSRELAASRSGCDVNWETRGAAQLGEPCVTGSARSIPILPACSMWTAGAHRTVVVGFKSDKDI